MQGCLRCFGQSQLTQQASLSTYLPQHADTDFNIPQEVWSGKPIDYSSLKIFGCPAYVHVQSGERTKLDPKSRKCTFLGFEKGVKGYRLWDPVSKKKVINKDVIFDETFML
jgi:hypothetical protein